MPYLVAGTYAFECFTGIACPAKDLKLLVRRSDCRRLLSVLEDAGSRTEMIYEHWLAKAFCGDAFVEVIFSSGNGAIPVDDMWLEESVPAQVLGVPVRLCPIEELIVMKAYLMERAHYDGADIAHLLRSHVERLDWHRLVWRFEAHWPLLLSHLILFGFIYPAERVRLPGWILPSLTARALREWNDASARICRGGLLSRDQYQVDFERWGYDDVRLYPRGKMTAEEISAWTPKNVVTADSRPHAATVK